MNLGYSLILQESVDATEVDHGDCIQFQIVCPSCNEGIFKAGKFGGDRQYFSHYPASKSDVAQCELRVGKMTRDQINHALSADHGQSLEQFFARFQAPLIERYYPRNIETRKRFSWAIARPEFVKFIRKERSSMRWEMAASDLFSKMETSLGVKGKTRFWLKRQRQFSEKFLAHLIAPNSTSAFAFLYFFAIHYLCEDKLSKDDFQILLTGKDKALGKMFSSWEESKEVKTCTMSFLSTFIAIPFFDIYLGTYMASETMDDLAVALKVVTAEVVRASG